MMDDRITTLNRKLTTRRVSRFASFRA